MLPYGKTDPYEGADRSLLQALGLLIVNFSQLEYTLTLGVAALMQGTRPDDSAHLVATKVNFRSMIDVFSCLYRYRCPTDTYDTLDALCKGLDGLNARRNELVHSFWGTGDTPGALTRVRSVLRRNGAREEKVQVSESDVLTLAMAIEHAYWEANEFVVERVILRVDDVL